MTDKKVFLTNWLIPYIKCLFFRIQLSLLRAQKASFSAVISAQAHSCFENVQIISTTITGTQNGSFLLLGLKTISVMD